MTDKTTEALKLAEEALTGLTENDSVNAYFEDKRNKALTAIREALADHVEQNLTMVAEPVKQEPVAWCNPSPTCARHIEGMPVGTQLHAAPVDAKAIRAEALEEAAKLCDENAAKAEANGYTCKGETFIDGFGDGSAACAAAIRELD
jgi:hypothetical protein